jgi:hypothetical protein
MKTWLASAGLATTLALATISGYAGEREDLESLRSSTLNLIRTLVREGLLTQEKADALIRDVERKTTPDVQPGTVEGKPAVRVPYVPETVKREITEEIRQEVVAQARSERWGDPGALPEWFSRFNWSGDLRLRYERDIFQSTNTPPLDYQAITGTTINNTQEDQNYYRLRARLGALISVSDPITVGLRVSTGNLTSPISTNQTLGNSFREYSLVLDRAFVRIDPAPWATLWGGRMPNPWFGTDMIWNENLNFDGVAATLAPNFTENLGGFVTLGAFPLQTTDPTPTTNGINKWLYGVQAGFSSALSSASRFKLGAALYDYRHVEGIPNPTLGSHEFDQTAPQFVQKGNSLFNIDNDGDPNTNLFALVSKFRLLNVTAALDLGEWDPVHVMLIGDYVNNIGFDRAEILARTGVDLVPKTHGYHARLEVGMPRMERRGDWLAYFGYKRIERDAVLDAFNDSDFHLGGTDARGFTVGASYAVAKNSWVNLRWMSANAIDGPPLAIDVLQLDLNVRF